jgi:UDP-glucose 4-epimerase
VTNARQRVLVTGGAGFIGSHVSHELVARGYRVTVLDDLSGGFPDNVPDGAELVVGSITDVALVERLFSDRGFDVVYHLAAYAAEGLSHFIRRFNYENNVIGSVTVINAAVNHGVTRFVFTSSIAVYGASPVLPMTEATTASPVDPYGIAKLSVERDLLAAKELFDLDFTIFRPHNVYGERQNIGDRYRNVVGIFMNQILRGEPMSVFGDGAQTRAFSYVRDITPVMVDALETPAACNEIFNIGADQPCSVLDLATAVARAMGVDPQVTHLPPRHEVVDAYSSHEKLMRVFGPRSVHTLDEGLHEMAAWVRRHGARTSQSFGDVEVRKNFPTAWSE